MFAENNGVKIWFELHGQGERAIILVPGFQIVHSESFKRSYVPFLSRHMRVLTLELHGNGRRGFRHQAAESRRPHARSGS